MSKILETKVKNLYDGKPIGFSKLKITIECPLDLGVSVTGEWIGVNGNVYLRMDDAWDFLMYVNEYRVNNPGHQFNRIAIFAEDSQVTDIHFSFDDFLQNQTMENIL